MIPNHEVQSCLSLHADAEDQNQSLIAIHCPAVWDSLLCFPPTLGGAIATQPCPSIRGSDPTKKAFRECGLNGVWLGRDGIPRNDSGWTNYTPCFTPEIRKVIGRLGSHDEFQTKMDIARNTRILEFFGLSFSFVALLLSLLIFQKFRTLRNSRTRLHRHLFVAMLIQVTIRLTLYIDQAITRPSFSLEAERTLRNENLRGIDNTPILCEAGYICLEYARTAMFMWMFVEGLYLHNMITVTVFEEKLSPLVYFIVGWIVPIPLTVAWALCTALYYGHTTSCWLGYNFTLYFWILEGPRLGVLMVNLAFLLNILRVLVTKLRQSNSSETQQARKAVKAALLLLPLLGLTNLLNMMDAPFEKSAWVFGCWSYPTHLLTSSQGFILACLYCYKNQEVQQALKKYFRTKVLGRNKVLLPNSSVRMTLLNNSPPVHNNDGRVIETRISVPSRRLATSTKKPTKRYLSRKQSNNNHRDNVEYTVPTELTSTPNKTRTREVHESGEVQGGKPTSGRFHLLLVTTTKKGDTNRFMKKDTVSCSKKASNAQDEDSANSISVVQEDILGEIVIAEEEEEEEDELEISDRMVVHPNSV